MSWIRKGCSSLQLCHECTGDPSQCNNIKKSNKSYKD